jgi:hypothetical protein
MTDDEVAVLVDVVVLFAVAFAFELLLALLFDVFDDTFVVLFVFVLLAVVLDEQPISPVIDTARSADSDSSASFFGAAVFVVTSVVLRECCMLV